MSYRLLILREAQKEMKKLPPDSYTRVKSAIMALVSDPRPRSCTKLTSRDGWRIRVGRYRIIYEIDDLDRTVTVLHTGHRRDVYR